MCVYFLCFFNPLKMIL